MAQQGGNETKFHIALPDARRLRPARPGRIGAAGVADIKAAH